MPGRCLSSSPVRLPRPGGETFRLAEQKIVLSGCSGGGKSTLLAELSRRGLATVEEPGRRVVEAELARGGEALPWVDMAAFARRAIDLALADLAAAEALAGPVFFDRGLVDAASALETATGEPEVERLGQAHRYDNPVFLTPPWPDIYVGDAGRRHGFEAAVAEYERLARDYPRLGYRVIVLPKVCVSTRADFVLAALR
jgi:predicted ATPase